MAASTQTQERSAQELEDTQETPGPPQLTYLQLFLRFLRFGALAWGGPVAQIAMIKRELVDEERWISRERFNRTLAVYQVLPGPEAHELCVFFGMHARGRLGALLAGLGFMLPGFLLMFLLSTLYLSVGLTSPLVAAVFAGFQAAVVALIVRAVHRIGEHALHDRWLLSLSAIALLASICGIHFAIVLAVAGISYALVRRGWKAPALLLSGALLAGAVAFWLMHPPQAIDAAAAGAAAPGQGRMPLSQMFFSGLRSGLLTFGGAYTVIPFLRRDAVEVGQWMSQAQFLDGLALGGVLPAPLIIFSTFVGHLGAGAAGAVAMTAGIFLPAFSFTLLGHELLERVVEKPEVHSLLDGITAGVVGLIAATSIELLFANIRSAPALLIFLLALFGAYKWKARAAVAGIVLGAGILGLLLY